MFNIKEELKKLPEKSGVYIMRDKDNNILYVGKAISLKRRVKQYFTKNNKTNRILKMVSLIDHFEYIVTDNEAEALILECNLIKKNRPKFNVLLKDDKTYPYIKIDLTTDYPNVYITRRMINDGSKYFGPYANPGSAKEMVDFIRERFQIRQCRNYKSINRACLNYHIKRCPAPCMGYISKEEYMKNISDVIMLLDGKTDKIIKKLDDEIKEYSNKQEYEKAAEVRDRKIAIERISEKQKVSNISENNIDVIGIYKNELSVCVEIFFVRGSKMIGREHYFFDELRDEKISNIIVEFLKQYYFNNPNIPNKIMIQEEIEDKELIEEMLTNLSSKNVEIKHPKRGEKLRFVEMAEKNAKITLENISKDKNEILLELKEKLKLKTIPRKIESFDISNLGGNFVVAAMCVMKDGEIKRNLSRRFKIKTVIGQDDQKCMEEVVERRIKHSIENPNGGFGTLPDVFLADGGITQMRAIKRAQSKYNLNIPIYGMVKNDKHQTRALINENREEIEISNKLMLAITHFQDEVHNTAIEYHRKVRDKEITKSVLDYINGIGKVKKQELLKKFGSVDKIKEASVEELCTIKGITKEIAEQLKEL